MGRRSDPREIRGPGGTLTVRSDDVAAVDFLMLVDGETSGRPLEAVLADFGCSRSSYYEKLKRFREQGLGGLWPKPSGPRQPWLRSMEVVRFIVVARLKSPEKTAFAIVEELAGRGHRVSLRSVERTLTEFGLTRGKGWGEDGV